MFYLSYLSVLTDLVYLVTIPTGKYMLKVTIETLEQCVKYVQVRRRYGVFIVKFKHISHIVMFLLVTLSR